MPSSYFSYRESKTPWGIIPLDYHFRHSFGDLWDQLGNSYELAIANGRPLEGDGRQLGFVECIDQATLDAVLRSFPNDLESLIDAVAKINSWDGRSGDDLASVENGEVVIPALN